GGRLHDRRLGAFGEISVLSFGRGKGTTTGHGGALLLRGDRAESNGLAARAELHPARRGEGAREIVALGAQWLLARPELYSLPSSIPMLRLGEMVYRAASEPRVMARAAAAVLGTALTLDENEVRARQEH